MEIVWSNFDGLLQRIWNVIWVFDFDDPSDRLMLAVYLRLNSCSKHGWRLFILYIPVFPSIRYYRPNRHTIFL